MVFTRILGDFWEGGNKGFWCVHEIDSSIISHLSGEEDPKNKFLPLFSATCRFAHVAPKENEFRKIFKISHIHFIFKKQTGQGREISLAGTWLEKQSMFPKKEAKKCSSIQKLHSSFLAILPMLLKGIEFKFSLPLFLFGKVDMSFVTNWVCGQTREVYGIHSTCICERKRGGFLILQSASSSFMSG